MRAVLIFPLILSLVPQTLAAGSRFHLLSRRKQTQGTSSDGPCKYTKTEVHIGAVPSDLYDCSPFMEDKYFGQLVDRPVLENIDDWSAVTVRGYPLCSTTVDFLVNRDAKTLQINDHNAPTVNLATCYYLDGERSILCGGGHNGAGLCFDQGWLWDAWWCEPKAESCFK